MLKDWIGRWREPVILLPLLTAIAIAAWVLLGAVIPEAGNTPADPFEPAASLLDAVVLDLIRLPVRTAYAVVPLAVAYLIWRRWRIKLTTEQQQDLWARLIAGEPGAIVAHITNAVVFLTCAVLLLYLFLR